MSCFSFEWDPENNYEKNDYRRIAIFQDPVKAQLYFYTPQIEKIYVYLEYLFEGLVDLVLAIFVLLLVAIPSGIIKGALKFSYRLLEDVLMPAINLALMPVTKIVGDLFGAIRGDKPISSVNTMAAKDIKDEV